ncbi:MAG: single-stranded-DNA-specific exonuclease RecJ [Candidatus Omnitrophota bacterium]|jgi:single-stranded-DNA-specific exonuclease
MINRIWNITKPDPEFCRALSKELDISPVLAQVLLNRGIKRSGEADKFLKARTSMFLDPLTLPDIKKAAARIKQAIKNKDKVMIFGDYDVDGITSVALLESFLKKLGLRVEHYLPHRIKEGYGLNTAAVKIAKAKGVKLFITVDCGTGSFDEVDELNKAGIDVIVTDHHEQSSDKLPKALAVINPKRHDSKYGFRELSGAGVAYKFIQAISGEVLEEELDLACLGTIADVVPLNGENRIIAKQGLKKLSETKRPGILALIEQSGIKKRPLGTMAVSFMICPRLNANGRMDSAETSLELLLSDSMARAQELAKLTNSNNQQRQKVEEKIFQEAQGLIDKEVNFKEHRVIVLAGEGWHQGVLGIVASKLADRFYRPTILLSLNEGLCKGSCRSIKNFHIFQALLECREFLSSFGGHSHAAGILIHKDRIQDFKAMMNTIAHQKLTLQDFYPSVDVDMELGFSDINEVLTGELEMMEPFGAGNPEAVFYTPNLKLKSKPQLLGRDTIKFWVTDGNYTYSAVGFGMGEFAGALMEAPAFDMLYTPSIDGWQGRNSLQLEIKDLRPHRKNT